MVKGRCPHRGCNFSFDDAEHNDDAVEKLRAHSRTQHSSKAFYAQRAAETVQSYNLSLDEVIEVYAGQDWRERLANGSITQRRVTQACATVCQYPWTYSEDLIREVQALSLEHGVEIQDPFANVPEPLAYLDVDGVDGGY